MNKVTFVLVNLAAVVLGFTIVVIGSICSANPDELFKPRDVLTSFPQASSYVHVLTDVWLLALASKAAAILIITGLIHLTLGILGWVGGAKGNAYLILLHSTSSLVLVAIEIGVAVFCYMHADVIYTQVADRLAMSIVSDYKSGVRLSNNGSSHLMTPKDKQELAWDNMQLSMQCCGLDSSADWSDVTNWNQTYILDDSVITAKVPISCCPRTEESQKKSAINDLTSNDFMDLNGCLTATSNIHKGCSHVLKDFIQNFHVLIGCCFVFMVLIQGLAILIACCMRAVSDKPDNMIKPI